MPRPRPQPQPSYNLNPEPVRWSLLAALFALALIFAPVPPMIVEEFYSRDMYPWLQDVFTGATNFIPLALLDAMLIGLALAFVLRVRRLFYVARQRGIIDAIWEAIRRIVRLAGLVTILFFWAWGFNYRRQPLEATLPERQAARPAVDVIEGAVIDASSLAARLRPFVTNGPELSYADLETRLKGPLNAALKQLGRLPLSRPARPKYSLVLTPFFSWAGMTGMVNPLGLETIVHPDLLPFERPFVLAHEWAHLSGHADEAEAKAIGWLACMKGGNELAYSASLYLIVEANASLPEERRKVLLPRLDSAVRSDIDVITRRARQEQLAVQYRRALALILTPSIRNAMGSYEISR
jgi:uncharacterized membrane protein